VPWEPPRSIEHKGNMIAIAEHVKRGGGCYMMAGTSAFGRFVT
jgi:hypothetical protein